MLGGLEQSGDALAAADAEGDQGSASASGAQLTQGGEDEAGSGGSDGMTEGDGSTRRIEAAGFDLSEWALKASAASGDGIAQGAKNGEDLGREGFIDLI